MHSVKRLAERPTRRRCVACEKYSSYFAMIGLFLALNAVSSSAKFVRFPYDQRFF
jgi:hypothetical protein